MEQNKVASPTAAQIPTHISVFSQVFSKIICVNKIKTRPLQKQQIRFIVISTYNEISIQMRKASRAMDAAFALEVLDKAPYVTVSFTRPDGTPYGVPLSLVRTDEKNFYFHCALEGDKLDCIAANPIVALSAVTRCTPTVGPKDGSFTLQYKSAMAVGKAEIVNDREEKMEALRAICLRFLPNHMDAFNDAIARSLERTAMVKITLIAPPTGKRKQYDKQGEEMKWGRTE